MTEEQAETGSCSFADALERGGEALATHAAALRAAPVETRRRGVRALEAAATTDPGAIAPALSACEELLTDDDRAVRLSTAKLFVAVAAGDPDPVVPSVPALAARLADDEEFYYVRARSAEALGYVALAHPETVASPAVLADLRVGLSFEGSEVREKLAKALELVATGSPDRLRHHLPDLATHLDDGSELVRYHLTTALLVVGCVHPAALADVADGLLARLDDEEPSVRGRALEACGVLARSSVDVEVPRTRLASFADDETFVVRRARFAAAALDKGEDAFEDVGTVAAVRGTTEAAVAAIRAPDGECRNCGVALPEPGPPICPRCGAPR
ncbi:HEAT repeat domain-containing protein [Halococcus hamelinensis]|uniref:HEAT repeat protein n=2 Tax=Halococcus hamelinensis TaxID=332168 RepID=M0M6X2_9EURY|nr:HEAT repeat domain-containing protein [Halococcus hamelinensis]EMA40120.1 HEAT repeat protein [Halococcus hamelinensis 100A6]